MNRFAADARADRLLGKVTMAGRGMAAAIRLPIGLWMIVALALWGCSKPSSPEAEIRTFVAQAQAAAEARDVSALRALIADDYVDSRGYDRKAVVNLIRLQVLSHQTIHVFTRIGAIEWPDPEHARLSVAVAMAGRPIAQADELVGVTADLYRFEFELMRDGDQRWRVRQAAWEPARLEDFW